MAWTTNENTVPIDSKDAEIARLKAEVAAWEITAKRLEEAENAEIARLKAEVADAQREVTDMMWQRRRAEERATAAEAREARLRELVTFQHSIMTPDQQRRAIEEGKSRAALTDGETK